MEAGALDRQITLEFKTSGQTASGEPTETWGTATVIAANVRAVSGREYYAALGAQIVAEEMLVCTVRYHANLNIRPGTARVLYETRTYNIRRVVELGRRQWLEIHADTAVA